MTRRVESPSRSSASSAPFSALLKLLPKRFAAIVATALALLALLPEKWRPFPSLQDTKEERNKKPRKAKPVLEEFPASIASIADGDGHEHE